VLVTEIERAIPSQDEKSRISDDHVRHLGGVGVGAYDANDLDLIMRSIRSTTMYGFIASDRARSCLHHFHLIPPPTHTTRAEIALLTEIEQIIPSQDENTGVSEIVKRIPPEFESFLAGRKSSWGGIEQTTSSSKLPPSCSDQLGLRHIQRARLALRELPPGSPLQAPSLSGTMIVPLSQ
jgi:hypothetical protein